MDKLPDFKKKSAIETGCESPFDIEEHLNDVRDKYQSYYNDLVKQFEEDLTSVKEKCIIKLASHWTCNNHHITVDFLLEKAVENFRFDLSRKQYQSTYMLKSERSGNDPDDYSDYNNWMELVIQIQ